jgi:YbbR domain-containing protein
MIRRLLFENLGWKLLSVALAFLLWLIVVDRPELARSVSVPIEYRNIPENLEMSSNVPDRVHLEVRGSSTRLEGADLSGAAVVLDLAAIHGPGERTFTIDEDRVRLPFGLRLVRAIPAQLRIEFEQRVSREVPVRVHFSTSPPAGYRVQGQEVSPAKIRIVGPASRVNGIEYAETDPIDLSQTVSAAEFRVHAFVRDPQVRFVSEPVVRVKVVLEKTQAG